MAQKDGKLIITEVPREDGLLLPSCDEQCPAQGPEACFLRPEDAEAAGYTVPGHGQIPNQHIVGQRQLINPPRDKTKEEIEEMMKEHDRIMEEASVPKWDEYRGDHHSAIPDPGIMQGGSVDFRRHLDKPLSKELWFDIVFRLRGFNLRVYNVGGSRWTDTWDNMTVWVDDNDIVRDIQYKPPCPYRFSLDDTICIERPGMAIGNLKGLAKADFR